MNELTDVIFLFLHSLFNQYGFPIVFIAAVVEATVGLGLVFPGVAIMFIAGAAAAQGEMSVTAVLVAAVAGTALGDGISYVGGRWGARWLLGTRLGPSLRLGAEIMRGRALWFIPFYHFHNITRSVGAFGSGLVRVPVHLWAPLDLSGVVLANLVWVGAGFVFGTAILTPQGTLQEHPIVRVGLVVIAVAYVLLMRRVMLGRLREVRRRRTDQEAARASASEISKPQVTSGQGSD